jgi:hypothetical protein
MRSRAEDDRRSEANKVRQHETVPAAIGAEATSEGASVSADRSAQRSSRFVSGRRTELDGNSSPASGTAGKLWPKGRPKETTSECDRDRCAAPAHS